MYGDWAVGNKVVTYHPLEVFLARIPHHCLCPPGLFRLQYFVFGEPLEVFAHGLDEHRVLCVPLSLIRRRMLS